ncbi:cytochrome P450 [Actinocorallia sp. A-T 12471]|uniref:cytochrome P450 n=1 Tax=Actinocorallia sp. A-T 12471 TaxID=3089813 RepID=UPI0029CACC21|nr:cytochrome P450 [Actinocorallia sp. A-T 12471]MDX6741483.1 cytochrome P450 [Actinocorallia sp. A-T 12471]
MSPHTDHQPHSASPKDADPMESYTKLAGDVRDPYPMLAAMLAEAPVHRIDLGHLIGRDTGGVKNPALFTVLGYEAVHEVLGDSKTYSSAIYDKVMGPVMGHTILAMDAPEHMSHRGKIAHVFRARALTRWSDAVIGATVDDLIDRFAARGSADLIRELTFPFPVQVIAKILGLPPEDYKDFQRLSLDLISIQNDRPAGLAASRALSEYFTPLIRERRADPRDDVISDLVRAEIDGRPLADEEILPFLLLLLPAGAETTYRSSSNLLFGLLSRPEQLAEVKADPETLLPQAIEEALRWEPPLLNVVRAPVRDVQLAGVDIPAGAMISVSIASAGRDAGRYADPDVFDLHRDPEQHIAFGHGMHLCLGMHLARLETRIMVTRLLQRLPDLRLDPDAQDVHIHGLMFRSPPELPVLFTPA